VISWPSALRLVFLERVVRASCPTKTRAPFCHMQLPNASSLQRTDTATRGVEKILASTPASILHQCHRLQFAELRGGPVIRFFFGHFEAWDERREGGAISRDQGTFESRTQPASGGDRFFSFSATRHSGVGTSADSRLSGRPGRHDVQFLANNLNTFLTAARKRPEIASLEHNILPAFRNSLSIVDRDKVLKLGAAPHDVYRTIQAFMGGSFINTSTASDASGRFTSRPEGSIGPRLKTWGSSTSQQQGRERVRSRR